MGKEDGFCEGVMIEVRLDYAPQVGEDISVQIHGRVIAVRMTPDGQIWATLSEARTDQGPVEPTGHPFEMGTSFYQMRVSEVAKGQRPLP